MAVRKKLIRQVSMFVLIGKINSPLETMEEVLVTGEVGADLTWYWDVQRAAGHWLGYDDYRICNVPHIGKDFRYQHSEHSPGCVEGNSS